MSKSSELGNILRRTVSGDKERGEDGYNLFSTIAAPSSAAFAVQIEEADERRNKTLYIKGFFHILEKILSPDELRFMKYKYNKPVPDHIIAGWLGIPNPLKIISKKVAANKRRFQRLKQLYPWEGAEMFERVLLSRFSDIVNNPSAYHFRRADQKTEERLALAEKTHEERMAYYAEYHKGRRPFRREYMRGYQSAKYKSIKELRYKLQPALLKLKEAARYLGVGHDSVLKPEIPQEALLIALDGLAVISKGTIERVISFIENDFRWEEDGGQNG